MITLDDEHPTPPFEQIRGQLADQIRAGTLAADHRLPSVRQLAADLCVATGTIARAYAALEAAGLISTSRGSGTRVRADQCLDDESRASARRFVHALQQRGVSLDDALSAVRAEWPRLP
ncbi:GntR family transcriptional regulator [Cryobacterium sp. TMT1-66-1]|uniref:GntR family transcriptional regulator n=1 Tax=Cryobacterium sp. TMT1-66-1 TaxID=1259242 RepID=UPI00106DB467|nr:GntR family transcriptional regulator [Cryobacterium sp. TMT1-66-1]TFD09283.1 GntR family transcriptional regulator [Cryobacterium sp. TMT1-66-1]